jgi:hypothetical protein
MCKGVKQIENERPYKLIKNNSYEVDSMSGLGNTDVNLGDNPFGLDLDEPLPKAGGKKTRRKKQSNKRKSNKHKSHKKKGGKRTLRNKKSSRKYRK